MTHATLNDLPILLAILGFVVMGIGALVSPQRVSRQFDIPTLTAAGRNEVRAVYGGFGLAMAAGLVAALALPGLRAGVCLTVAAALAGMAGGRLVSAGIDRTLGRLPALYLVLEAVMAAALVYAALGRQA
ncbi:MAG: DUF4345 family protein [Phenylobacterium sp.]|jgi:hypothetical protein|uniref:DUF4345 family protein n=1 Tax=Phenylobacterium sp. TaxID=1871053 RepID=UPI0025F47A9C|nr:DUF4345 family protein [Phenylobacterium sp.]MCA6299790.1 DUF4345 family protein [Phenylobacterium sp.]